MRAVGLGVGQEDAPAVVGHLARESKLAQPSWPTEIGGAQVHVVVLEARPGPARFHHSMNFGCHDSSARCSRRSSARSTLLGILASMSTIVVWSWPHTLARS